MTEQINSTKMSRSGMVVEIVLDFIFPEKLYCISCGNLITKETPFGLCAECSEDISWIRENACFRCGRETGKTNMFCTCCRDRAEHSYIDRGFLCVNYREIEKMIVRRLKYSAQPYLAKQIAEIMYAKLSACDVSVDILVAVPMHKKRKSRRGYNQADLISKYLAKLMNMMFVKDAIIRTIDTKPMSDLDASERRINVESAFILNADSRWSEYIKDKSVLLIDDVYTTGNTAEACAKILKGAGAKKVYFCAFASARSDMVTAQVCG